MAQAVQTKTAKVGLIREPVTLIPERVPSCMEFDQFGHLTPYEVIETNLSTFEAVFARAFPKSQTRSGIFAEYIRYVTRLRDTVGEDFTMWVNGSFVTQKLNPRDIDFVTFLDSERYNAHENELGELRQLRLEQGSLTDGFFVKVYPESHPNRKFYGLDRSEWLFDFGRSRTRYNTPFRNKGIIQLTF
ncbi:MAG: hypothetical protein LH606_13990 [Cytophagaceae bacterium]|nr:hypothetical protein [Cytophagaceae bacterium]